MNTKAVQFNWNVKCSKLFQELTDWLFNGTRRGNELLRSIQKVDKEVFKLEHFIVWDNKLKICISWQEWHEENSCAEFFSHMKLLKCWEWNVKLKYNWNIVPLYFYTFGLLCILPFCYLFYFESNINPFHHCPFPRHTASPIWFPDESGRKAHTNGNERLVRQPKPWGRRVSGSTRTA